jgi:hypothetical protein
MRKLLPLGFAVALLTGCLYGGHPVDNDDGSVTYMFLFHEKDLFHPLDLDWGDLSSANGEVPTPDKARQQIRGYFARLVDEKGLTGYRIVRLTAKAFPSVMRRDVVDAVAVLATVKFTFGAPF